MQGTSGISRTRVKDKCNSGLILSYFSIKKKHTVCSVYSLDVAHQGTPNMYPQCMFFKEKIKNKNKKKKDHQIINPIHAE